MNKILYFSVKLNCDVKTAFEKFTVNEKIVPWLTMDAEIEPVVGGKYELFWEPDDRENNSTIGCKVTAIEPKFLAVEWKGAKQFKHFMNNVDPLTQVTVAFIPVDGGKATEVHLIHTGWRSTPEWEEARLWFEGAWKMAFERLVKEI